MSIRIRCPECESLFKLPDNLAGKTVRCKGCGSTIKVPAPEAGVDEAAEILAAIESAADVAAQRRAADDETIATSAKSLRDADDGDVKSAKTKGRGKQAPGSRKRMSMAVLAILVVVLLVVLGGAAGGAYLFLFGGPPPQAKAKPVALPKNPGQAKGAAPPDGAKGEESKEETDPAKGEAIPVEAPISYAKKVQQGDKGSEYTLWVSPLGLLAPTASPLSLDKGRSASTVIITSAVVGDRQWVLLPLSVPSNVKIKKLIVCYVVANERSYLNQVRLTEERVPPPATVMHDAQVDLKSTTGDCYESRVNSLRAGGALTLWLKLNFTELGDSISIGAIGLVVEP